MSERPSKEAVEAACAQRLAVQRVGHALGCICVRCEDEAALHLDAFARTRVAEAKSITIPKGLHSDTADLVVRFASALASKLRAAESKYGYSDGWKMEDWMDECRERLADHVRKGDPRDVAAFCAFLWHHGARTFDREDSWVAGAEEDAAQAEASRVAEAVAAERGRCLNAAVDLATGEFVNLDALEDAIREAPHA